MFEYQNCYILLIPSKILLFCILILDLIDFMVDKVGLTVESLE